MRKINWPIWLGFIITVFAFISYPLIFINWPVTRDFPWANIALFVAAATLLFFGIRRAFAPDRRRLSKIVAAVVAVLSVVGLSMFIFLASISARWLPASAGATQGNPQA